MDTSGEATQTFFALLLVLSLGLAGGTLARLARQPVLAGYIVAGIILGIVQHTFHLVAESETVQAFADLGVTFLMFSLGAHFSLQELFELRRIVLRAGIPQVIGTAVLTSLVIIALGRPVEQAIFFGEVVALSSSIVALSVLEDRQALGEAYARLVLGIGLAQDLLVVPLLAMLSALSHGETWQAAFLGIMRSLSIALVMLVVLLVLGTRIIPRMLYQVARLGSRELFLITLIALAFAIALAAQGAGLSLALGAFLAGVAISESEFAAHALGEITPLRDVFSVLFFAGLGLLFDPRAITTDWQLFLTLLGMTILGKLAVTSGLLTRLGYPPEVAVQATIPLLQIGEFSFVLVLQAEALGVVPSTAGKTVIAVVIVSTLLTSPLATLAPHLVPSLSRLLAPLARPTPSLLPDRPAPPLRGHTIVAGFGRTGRELVRALERRHFRYVIVDRDADLVRQLRQRNLPVIYGDIANPEVLRAAHIEQARVLALAIPDAFAAERAIRLARSMNPVLDIIVRADRRADVRRFAEAGATEVVHPSFEAGLEMVRHTLRRFGVSMQEIQAQLSARRIDYYEESTQADQ